jgi:hypothetical protein
VQASDQPSAFCGKKPASLGLSSLPDLFNMEITEFTEENLYRIALSEQHPSRRFCRAIFQYRLWLQPNLAVIASECFSSEAIPACMGRLLRRRFAPPRNDDRVFAVGIDAQG